MCITVISICHKHMLANTTYCQNKSYAKSVRQYAKRRTTDLFPSAYSINITKCHQKIISHSGVCLGLSTYGTMSKTCQNKCGNIQITYMYKIPFPIFNGTYHWDLVNKIP